MPSGAPIVTIAYEIVARSGKRQELLRTLDELHPAIRLEKGCRGIGVSWRKSPGGLVAWRQEWANADAALQHCRSESFRVVCGAILVLTQSTNVTVSAESRTVSEDLTGQNLHVGIQGLIQKASAAKEQIE